MTDYRDGVQWHAVVWPEDQALYFGVNLEGLTYDGWPIARLLRREAESPQLPELARLIRDLDEVILRMTRDAWQAAIRPPIEEWHICWRSLIDLDEDVWRVIVEECLGCLGGTARAASRGRQAVTLKNSRERREMPTSPHLHFWVKILDEARTARRLEGAIREASLTLLPLYSWVTARSAP